MRRKRKQNDHLAIMHRRKLASDETKLVHESWRHPWRTSTYSTTLSRSNHNVFFIRSAQKSAGTHQNKLIIRHLDKMIGSSCWECHKLIFHCLYVQYACSYVQAIFLVSYEIKRRRLLHASNLACSLAQFWLICSSDNCHF